MDLAVGQDHLVHQVQKGMQVLLDLLVQGEKVVCPESLDQPDIWELLDCQEVLEKMVCQDSQVKEESWVFQVLLDNLEQLGNPETPDQRDLKELLEREVDLE